MNTQPQEFTGMSKPEMFPYFKKPLPNKNFKMFANDEQKELYESKKFPEILNKNLDSSGPKNLNNVERVQIAINQMTMMMVAIQQGFDSLPLHMLAMMELENSINNFEKVKDSKFVSYASSLQGAIFQAQTKYDEEKRKRRVGIESDDEELLEEEEKKNLPAKGSTYIHNANLYKGMNTDNPFKEQGDEYDVYDENPVFAMQRDQFMNTQSIRGKALKERVDNISKEHQDSMPELEGVTDPFTDTEIEEFSIRGNNHTLLTTPELRENWEAKDYHAFIVNRWSDHKNISKVTRSVGGRAYSQFESISKIQKAQKIEESETEFNSYIEEIDFALNAMQELQEELESAEKEEAEDLALELLEGNFDDTSKLIEIEDQIKDLVALLDPKSNNLNKDQQALFDEKRGQSQSLIGNIEKEEVIDFSDANYVLDNVNKKLPNAGMFLPYSVFMELASEITNYMDLGFWGKSTHELSNYIKPEEDGFIDQSISGYMELEIPHLTTGIYANNPIKSSQLAVDITQYGEVLLEELKNMGILNIKGEVTEKFNENMTIVSDKTENERIIGVLREAKLGEFNFEIIDQTQVSGKKRRNTKLLTPTGDQLNLMDMAEILQKEGSPKERYSQIREIYNINFDMFEKITGGSLEGASFLDKPNIQVSKDGSISMDIYEKATWEEWTEYHHIEVNEKGNKEWVPGWDTVEGPLSLEFKTISEAEKFYQRIRKTMATLEPIVGMFEPKETVDGLSQTGWSYQNGESAEVFVRLLNDNIGFIGEHGIIDPESSNYKLEIDYMYHDAFFKTEQWKGVSKHVISKSNLAIGIELFQTSIGNRIIKLRHSRRKEDYKKLKKEHFENEERRIVAEIKQYLKRIAKNKLDQKKYLAKIAKRLKEMKAAMIRSRKESKLRAEKNKKEAAQRRTAKK